MQRPGNDYPGAAEYVAAVEHPERAFRNPELRDAEFALHPIWQIPWPASGNSSVVFKAEVKGQMRALRFFIRATDADKSRYEAVADHFTSHGLLDLVASPRWVDDAIHVDGHWWPMVQMDWIEGQTLDDHVGRLASRGDVAGLRALAARWRACIGQLQGAGYAHGDLQHGNVLVDATGAPRLVDFDSSWVSALARLAPPRESGHPNYQRPGQPWGRWMDTFPGLVVYASLLATARRPDAWAGSLPPRRAPHKVGSSARCCSTSPCTGWNRPRGSAIEHWTPMVRRPWQNSGAGAIRGFMPRAA